MGEGRPEERIRRGDRAPAQTPPETIGMQIRRGLLALLARLLRCLLAWLEEAGDNAPGPSLCGQSGENDGHVAQQEDE